MGVIYRLTVVKETTDPGGGYEGDETLFELAGSATMLGRIAPSAVLDALIADEHSGGAPAQQQVLADKVWDAAVANGTVPAGTPSEAPQPEAPKRTRRTKQQIAEDKAREAQQASLQAHANSAAQGGPGVPAPQVETVDVSSGTNGAAVAPGFTQPAAAPAAAQPAAPTANGAEAPVYNPFAVG